MLLQLCVETQCLRLKYAQFTIFYFCFLFLIPDLKVGAMDAIVNYFLLTNSALTYLLPSISISFPLASPIDSVEVR